MRILTFILIVFISSSCKSDRNDSNNTGIEASRAMSIDKKEVPTTIKSADVEENQTENNHETEGDEIAEEEEDCIFNDDFYGLTTEAISNYDSSLNYTWDDENGISKLLLGQDTVELSIGGCDHFGLTGSYISRNKDIQDTAFWFIKAKWIGNSFWGPVGSEFSQKIESSQLLKTENQDGTYYEFPADTT